MRTKRAMLTMLAVIMALIFTVPASASTPALQYPYGYTLVGGGDLTITGYATRGAYPGNNDVLLYKGSALHSKRDMFGIGHFSHTYYNLPAGTYYFFFPGNPWSISDVTFTFH
ncbi:hypothetical protein [Paenibacillus paeoniae]|uniref:Uncharacterized protein n=1 Tax=Paenibacillus paeoniae TaxID=2292705 RepID=A0A371PIY6_9BACL|nr:hypothetical protein [Paenibacillus paeoniae]REK76186.1 hypothetical protein DX130_03765 [Paenibacillus paeoniae]